MWHVQLNVAKDGIRNGGTNGGVRQQLPPAHGKNENVPLLEICHCRG